MYFFDNGIIKLRTQKNILILFLKLKPYLKHGSIILVSNFQNITALISPTPIKHSAFCYIENDTYYAIEMSENGLKKTKFIDFLNRRNYICVFDYYDTNIMHKTMDYIYNYKDCSYGFFNNNQYCFKIIFSIYNDALNKPYKNMSEFCPVFVFFGVEYVNSNSILKSQKFIPRCCVIENYFICFK